MPDLPAGAHPPANCKPGDPVEREGLVHAWRKLGVIKTTAVYRCDHCGQRRVTDAPLSKNEREVLDLFAKAMGWQQPDA